MPSAGCKLHKLATMDNAATKLQTARPDSDISSSTKVKISCTKLHFSSTDVNDRKSREIASPDRGSGKPPRLVAAMGKPTARNALASHHFGDDEAPRPLRGFNTAVTTSGAAKGVRRPGKTPQ